jgi:hypothetical protein
MKKHFKGSKKTAPKRNLGAPVFSYTSVCCSVQATKEPCTFVGKDSKEAETQGLGHFRCTGCRKSCKCTRSKNKKENETSAEIV